MNDFETDPAVEQLLAAAQPRAGAAPARRELWGELAAGAALIAACAALAALAPGGHWESPAVVATLVAAYALVGRARFDIGAGYTTPSQLVLVPILFSVPAWAVPLVVLMGGMARRLPDVAGGRVHPLRLVMSIPDTWHAVGPAAVLALAGSPAPALADWPLYMAAFGAQAGVDLGTSVLREWVALGVSPALQLRVVAVIGAVDFALAPIGLLVALAMRDTPTAVVCVLPLAALLVHFARERDGRIQQSLQLSTAYSGTALLMGDVLEADDSYTGGEHSHGVVALAVGVGREMGLSPREMRNLEFGSQLHDIGKLRVSSDIINKPGRLTDAEWEIIRRHPEDGQAMLERIGGTMAEVGRIVRAHHERVDGGGYPDGLRGEDIPLAARIVCACDAYSAMTTTRAYRAAMPEADALAELRRCAGAQFDPGVVDALCAVVERRRLEALSLVPA
jgi:HD-GYP domain-containing protein (c-di-GMP phosphodiesterase class II)